MVKTRRSKPSPEKPVTPKVQEKEIMKVKKTAQWKDKSEPVKADVDVK